MPLSPKQALVIADFCEKTNILRIAHLFPPPGGASDDARLVQAIQFTEAWGWKEKENVGSVHWKKTQLAAPELLKKLKDVLDHLGMFAAKEAGVAGVAFANDASGKDALLQLARVRYTEPADAEVRTAVGVGEKDAMRMTRAEARLLASLAEFLRRRENSTDPPILKLRTFLRNFTLDPRDPRNTSHILARDSKLGIGSTTELEDALRARTRRPLFGSVAAEVAATEGPLRDHLAWRPFVNRFAQRLSAEKGPVHVVIIDREQVGKSTLLVDLAYSWLALGDGFRIVYINSDEKLNVSVLLEEAEQNAGLLLIADFSDTNSRDALLEPWSGSDGMALFSKLAESPCKFVVATRWGEPVSNFHDTPRIMKEAAHVREEISALPVDESLLIGGIGSPIPRSVSCTVPPLANSELLEILKKMQARLGLDLGNALDTVAEWLREHAPRTASDFPVQSLAVPQLLFSLLSAERTQQGSAWNATAAVERNLRLLGSTGGAAAPAEVIAKLVDSFGVDIRMYFALVAEMEVRGLRVLHGNWHEETLAAVWDVVMGPARSTESWDARGCRELVQARLIGPAVETPDGVRMRRIMLSPAHRQLFRKYGEKSSENLIGRVLKTLEQREQDAIETAVRDALGFDRSVLILHHPKPSNVDKSLKARSIDRLCSLTLSDTFGSAHVEQRAVRNGYSLIAQVFGELPPDPDPKADNWQIPKESWELWRFAFERAPAAEVDPEGHARFMRALEAGAYYAFTRIHHDVLFPSAENHPATHRLADAYADLAEFKKVLPEDRLRNWHRIVRQLALAAQTISPDTIHHEAADRARGFDALGPGDLSTPSVSVHRPR